MVSAQGLTVWKLDPAKESRQIVVPWGKAGLSGRFRTARSEERNVGLGKPEKKCRQSCKA